MLYFILSQFPIKIERSRINILMICQILYQTFEIMQQLTFDIKFASPPERDEAANKENENILYLCCPALAITLKFNISKEANRQTTRNQLKKKETKKGDAAHLELRKSSLVALWKL